MATINKEDMTITVVCQSEDEASARADLQELLEANPGYKPVLTVEDAAGKEKTYSSLSVAPNAQEEPAEQVVEEIATEDEVVEEATDEETVEEESPAEESTDEESTDEETAEEEEEG